MIVGFFTNVHNLKDYDLSTLILFRCYNWTILQRQTPLNFVSYQTAVPLRMLFYGAIILFLPNVRAANSVSSN